MPGPIQTRHASDTVAGNKWCDTGHNTRGSSTLLFDLGAAYPFQSYNFFTANDTVGRDPANWTLEASNDNVNWTLLDTRTGFVATATRNVWAGPFFLS